MELNSGERTLRISCILFLLAALVTGGSGQTVIIINHACTKLDSIPGAYLDAARVSLRIGYGHTLHGSQLITGWDVLKSIHRGKFSFTASSSGLVPGVFLNDNWPSPAGGADLGGGGEGFRIQEKYAQR
jgi:hypothetical protein